MSDHRLRYLRRSMARRKLRQRNAISTYQAMVLAGVSVETAYALMLNLRRRP